MAEQCIPVATLMTSDLNTPVNHQWTLRFSSNSGPNKHSTISNPPVAVHLWSVVFGSDLSTEHHPLSGSTFTCQNSFLETASKQLLCKAKDKNGLKTLLISRGRKIILVCAFCRVFCILTITERNVIIHLISCLLSYRNNWTEKLQLTWFNQDYYIHIMGINITLICIV